MVPAHFQVTASCIDLIHRRAPVLLVLPSWAQGRARLMPCCVQAGVSLQMHTSASGGHADRLAAGRHAALTQLPRAPCNISSPEVLVCATRQSQHALCDDLAGSAQVPGLESPTSSGASLTSAEARPAQTSAGLPFQSANMTFKHIWYSVDPPGVSIYGTGSAVLTAMCRDHVSCPMPGCVAARPPLPDCSTSNSNPC